jgi:hypothetical protein
MWVTGGELGWLSIREPLRSGWSVKDGFYSTQLIDATSYKYTNPNKPKCTGSFQKSNRPCLQPRSPPSAKIAEHQTAGLPGSSRSPSPDRQTVGLPGLLRSPSLDCQTAGSLESQITKGQDRRTPDRWTVGFAEITQPRSPDRQTFRASDRRAPDPHLQTKPRPSETRCCRKPKPSNVVGSPNCHISGSRRGYKSPETILTCLKPY